MPWHSLNQLHEVLKSDKDRVADLQLKCQNPGYRNLNCIAGSEFQLCQLHRRQLQCCLLMDFPDYFLSNELGSIVLQDQKVVMQLFLSYLMKRIKLILYPGKKS